jgi:8-oxo-dGTP diphosphatase
MATQLASAELPVIRAAGGILLRESPGGDEVMIVFRARHQDWTLPKGKLKDGESFQEAALREVEEETGCRCNLGSYLGMISYAQDGVPKVVMFWKMLVIEEKPRPESEEITEALWLPVPAAIQCLTYAQEKAFLTRSAPIRARPVEEPEPETDPRLEPFNAESRDPESPWPELVELPDPEPEAARALHVVSAIEPEQSPSPVAAIVETVVEPSPVIESEPYIKPIPAVEAAAAAAPVEPKPSLLTAAPTVIPARSNIAKPVKRVVRLSPKNPRLRAFAHELDVFRVEIAFLGHRNPDLRKSWEPAVQQHLENTARSLENEDLAGANVALRAARRYAVLGLIPVELSARAQVLRDQALQMLSWRGAAIQRLLAMSDDKLTAPRVADAMLLRDEDDLEQHERSRISNFRLRTLLVIGILGALVLVLSFSTNNLPLFETYAPLGFLGLVGALLTSARQIVQGREDGRITGQLTLIALALLGAVAALAADVIYKYVAHYFNLKHSYDPATYALAFVLGYATVRTLSHFAGYSREHITVHY